MHVILYGRKGLWDGDPEMRRASQNIWVGPNLHLRCPSMREAEGDLTPPWRREGNVTAEAEIGVVWPHYRMSVTTRGHKREETQAPLEPLERAWSHWLLAFDPAIRLVDFWPPELEESKFLLFQATRFVVICDSNHWKLRWRTKGTFLLMFPFPERNPSQKAYCRLLFKSYELSSSFKDARR